MGQLMLGGFWESFFANRDAAAMLLTGMAVAVIPMAVGLGYRLLKERSDNELKQSMVERGMSAEEIERVMQAGKSKKWWR